MPAAWTGRTTPRPINGIKVGAYPVLNCLSQQIVILDIRIYECYKACSIDHWAAISLLDEKSEIAFQKLDTKLAVDEFVAKIEALSPTHK
jgi:hypothetical protein